MMDDKNQSNNKFKKTIPNSYSNKVNEIKRSICSEIDNRKGKLPKWKIQDFELGYKLGRGEFGPTVLARVKASKFIVALKILYKERIENEECLLSTEKEINILSKLHHSNILTLYTYFHDKQRIYLVFEFAEYGDIYTLLQKQTNGKFKEGDAARYLYQVCDAVEYCHQMNIIHRDIKPENLLLDINGTIKVTGFSCSAINKVITQKRKTICGTLGYLSPEVVLNHEYDFLIDNWSIGVLCYELLVGYPPFQSNSEDSTLKKIVETEIFYPAVISANARDLIKKLIRFKPSERLSLTEVMAHRWIVQYNKNKKLFQK